MKRSWPWPARSFVGAFFKIDGSWAQVQHYWLHLALTSPYYAEAGTDAYLFELVRVYPVPERACPGDVFQPLGLASVTGSCRSSSKGANQPRATRDALTRMALRHALARDTGAA